MLSVGHVMANTIANAASFRHSQAIFIPYTNPTGYPNCAAASKVENIYAKCRSCR
jgi:hypothetical protein